MPDPPVAPRPTHPGISLADEAVDRFHNTRVEEAKDEDERERIQTQHHAPVLTLAAIAPLSGRPSLV